MTACRSCGAEVLWVVVTRTGAGMPLDREQLDFAAAGLVAVNHETGGARVMTRDDLVAVERWRAQGVTIHRSHFATCPSAERHRVSPAQEALDLQEDSGARRPLTARGGGQLATSSAGPSARRGQPDPEACA